MNRKIGRALIGGVGVAVLIGGGTALVMQNAAGAARTTVGQHVVMHTAVDIPTSAPGLVSFKLRDATTGDAVLSGRIAVSSITIAQEDGTQAIAVGIHAATCNNANGFGSIEDVVVPINQTVHLDYPGAVRMPFVAAVPASWCLYAQTVPDGGRLYVSVNATTV